MIRLLRAALVGALGCHAAAAVAEPWISTRFAQHCSSCHAPGRYNLKPIDRRCTLSCQGCHVNPNGGGLRSFYGKWTEDRILRSARVPEMRHARSFAPTDKQLYGGDRDEGEKDDKKKDDKDGKEKSKKKARKKAPKRGFPLVEIKATTPPEARYMRDGREYTVVPRQEFLDNIPEGDPYRLMDQSKVDGGGDIRWQVASMKRDDADPQWRSFLMAADFGLRHRPFHRKLHLVYEFRMLGNPRPGADTEDSILAAGTRSLYAMVEDLPWNIFVMGGLYKPLFGNYVADHYTLTQEMISFGSTGTTKSYVGQLWNAVSIGTAPNVPYANFHIINGRAGIPDDRTYGFATNLGLRFVSYGASINYSYWSTEEKKADAKTSVQMHSLGAAATYWRTVASLEAVSVARDVSTEDFRQGGVYMLDTYTRIWRENYATFMYATANTTVDVRPGSTSQVKVGARSFIIPGVELQLYLENREESAENPATGETTTSKTSGYAGQLHLFF